jgi:hypothetical protein
MRDLGLRDGKRTLPDAHREPGLAKRRDLCGCRKTAEGRRLVPMSRRVFEIPWSRCDAGRSAGSSHQSAQPLVIPVQSAISFESSQQAGFLKELVLYCARHDYGTRVLHANRKPCRRDENDAPSRRKDRNALSTSGTGKSVRAAVDYRPPTTEAAV